MTTTNRAKVPMDPMRKTALTAGILYLVTFVGSIPALPLYHTLLHDPRYLLGGASDTLQRGQTGASPWTAGLDIDDFGGSTPKLVAAAGCSAWSPNQRNVTAAVLAQAHALGRKVIPWTVNEHPDMERLIQMGADGIITDYPNRLRAVMAEKEIPLPPAVPVR